MVSRHGPFVEFSRETFGSNEFLFFCLHDVLPAVTFTISRLGSLRKAGLNLFSNKFLVNYRDKTILENSPEAAKVSHFVPAVDVARMYDALLGEKFYRFLRRFWFKVAKSAANEFFSSRASEQFGAETIGLSKLKIDFRSRRSRSSFVSRNWTWVWRLCSRPEIEIIA